MGPKETFEALDLGQVDELLISASLEREPGKEIMADQLVTKAAQTSAKVTFIEDPALLAPVEGVGALLRYRIEYREKAA